MQKKNPSDSTPAATPPLFLAKETTAGQMPCGCVQLRGRLVARPTPPRIPARRDPGLMGEVSSLDGAS